MRPRTVAAATTGRMPTRFSRPAPAFAAAPSMAPATNEEPTCATAGSRRPICTRRFCTCWAWIRTCSFTIVKAVHTEPAMASPSWDWCESEPLIPGRTPFQAQGGEVFARGTDGPGGIGIIVGDLLPGAADALDHVLDLAFVDL